MKRFKVRVAAALAAVTLAVSGCSAAQQSESSGEGPEPVTLTLASAFPENHSNNMGLFLFVDRLKEKAPWIDVQFKGGPELMAPTQLVEGISAGVFDMGAMPGDYYTSQMPAMNIPRFTPFTPMEEREKGIAAAYDEMHRDQFGITYLGHVVSGIPQVILLREPMENLDLKHKSIRGSSAVTQLIADLKGIPVDLPGSEVYTALERNVVQGAAWASVGPSSLSLYEVTSYDIAPRSYESLANLMMNEKKYESLDPESQQAIQDTIAEVEPEIFTMYMKQSIEETQQWRDNGVQELTLNDEETQRYLEISYLDGWKTLDWDRILRTTPAAQKIKEAFEAEFKGDLREIVPGGYNMERTKQIVEELSNE